MKPILDIPKFKKVVNQNQTFQAPLYLQEAEKGTNNFLLLQVPVLSNATH